MRKRRLGRSGLGSASFKIADKCEIVGLDSRPVRIRQVVDASPEPPRTDRIDLQYQHRVDYAVPMQDVGGVLQPVSRRSRPAGDRPG